MKVNSFLIPSLLLILLWGTSIFASDQYSSERFRDPYLRGIYSDFGEQSVANAASREAKAQKFWNQSFKTDDPAYTLALMIDFYNSLPADTHGGDRMGLNDGEVPGKGNLWHFTVSRIEAATNPNNVVFQQLPITIQTALRFFAERGVVDDPTSPPSMAVQDLDLANPSQLPALREYLAQNLEDYDYDKWKSEDAKWLNGSEAVTAPLQDQPEPQQARPEPLQKNQPAPIPDHTTKPETPGPAGETTTEGAPWGVIAIVALVALAAFFALRRRKPDGET